MVLNNSYKDFFNFHGILSTTPQGSRTQNEVVSAEPSDQLVNKTKHRGSIKSLELTNGAKDESMCSLDGDFEDFEAELEWSDNDITDNASLSSASLTYSGINENEATAGSCTPLQRCNKLHYGPLTPLLKSMCTLPLQCLQDQSMDSSIPRMIACFL